MSKAENMSSGQQKKNILDDDVFLVSYPKSGNTWIRFLIGNYLTGNKCDFANLHLIIPDIHYNPEHIDKLETPRFIKSHNPFTTDYKRVIYIVRDVRDIAVSYFFYALKFRIIDSKMNFNTFLTDIFDNGIIDSFTDWSSHVNSYLDNHSEDFLLVKYENLLQDTVYELTQILKFSKLPLRHEDIVSAVDSSSFLKMQKMEKIQVELFELLKNSDQSIQFIRQGTVGTWQNWFDGDLLAYILCKHGKVMQRLDYIPIQFIDLQKKLAQTQVSLENAEENLSKSKIELSKKEEKLSLYKENLELTQNQLKYHKENLLLVQRDAMKLEGKISKISKDDLNILAYLSHLKENNIRLKKKVKRLKSRNHILVKRNRENSSILKDLRLLVRQLLVEKRLAIDKLSNVIKSIKSSKAWRLCSYLQRIKRLVF